MSASSTKLKEPSVLLAASNCRRMVKNLGYVLDLAAIQALEKEIDRNVRGLFQLADGHLEFAKTINPAEWRQKISRLYYAAYNFRRAVALHYEGHFATDSSDHKNVGELPDDFPNGNTFEARLQNLRDDRNMADYNHRRDRRLDRSSDRCRVTRARFSRRRTQLPQWTRTVDMNSATGDDAGSDSHAREVMDAVAQRLSSVQPTYHVRDRADGPYLVVEVAKPNERLFRALREAQRAVSDDNPFRERATVLTRTGSPVNRLLLPETQLLRATLSESLTVDQHTFSSDFFSRYTRSVFGFEDQIVADGNHIVYGRRGSGKSSLLAYAMHFRKKQARPYAWVGMQAYADRDDIHVSVDVLSDVLDQLATSGEATDALAQHRQALSTIDSLRDDEASKALARLIPKIGREIAKMGTAHGSSTIFIDDVHVLSATAQPKVLAHLYGVSRGNKCHLKISGIEQFSHPWDAVNNIGLQAPHDAQV